MSQPFANRQRVDLLNRRFRLAGDREISEKLIQVRRVIPHRMLRRVLAPQFVQKQLDLCGKIRHRTGQAHALNNVRIAVFNPWCRSERGQRADVVIIGCAERAQQYIESPSLLISSAVSGQSDRSALRPYSDATIFRQSG